MNAPLLSVQGISKQFPGVLALDTVDLDVLAGEVHALCGENGAGKSTLMRILSGNLPPDAGTMRLRGEEVLMQDQQMAHQAGIGIVHQERSLVSNLSVAENIFAGNQPTNRWGFIRHQALYEQTHALLERLGIGQLSPKARLSHLSPGQQQMVEIAKALSQEPDLLILDEPTAALSEADTDLLFDLIRKLTQQGTGIIYISHRMAEIFEVADRVSVLKDGRYQGTRQVKETNVDEIIRLMVGRDLVWQDYEAHTQAEPLLRVSNLSGARFQDISFALHAGEILGMAGLVGAGRTEVARAIFGADPITEGQIWFRGKEGGFSHPAAAMAAGLGYLPESRKEQGLFLDMSVADNLVATDLNATTKGRWIQRGMKEQVSQELVERLGVKTPSLNQQIALLSGGNQQKVVLAKWLLRAPAVLMVDEPTHGVDVGAKSEIYALLKTLTAQGVGILLISSDLPELLHLSDRLLVMRNGQLRANLPREEFEEETIMHYASGTMVQRRGE
ncbi:MAG: sugar ABC transporter ATP-binding protein [Bacteroidota bacterium]